MYLNAFKHAQGCGRGLVITHIFEIVKFAERMRKECGKLCGKPQTFDFSRIFLFFIPLIPLVRKCINDEFLHAKIVPRGGGGSWGRVFTLMRKCVKKFSKCLIFKDLLFSATFPHPLRKLYANRKILDFQRFANIKQVLDFQRFYAFLRCWGGSRVGC